MSLCGKSDGKGGKGIVEVRVSLCPASHEGLLSRGVKVKAL